MGRYSRTDADNAIETEKMEMIKIETLRLITLVYAADLDAHLLSAMDSKNVIVLLKLLFMVIVKNVMKNKIDIVRTGINAE